MSLINQMLKDLEQRGANTHHEPPPLLPASVNVQKRTLPLGPLLIAAICALSIALAYVLLKQSNTLQSDMHTDVVMPTVSATTTKINQPAGTSEPTAGESMHNIAETAPASPQNGVVNANETSADNTAIPGTSTVIDNQSEKSSPVAVTAVKQSAKAAATTTDRASIDYVGQRMQSNNTPVSGSPTHATQHETPTVAINKQIRPEQTTDYQQQSLAYLQQGRVTEAINVLHKALTMNPSHHEARLTLASILLDNNRQTEVIALLTAGLTVAPEQSAFRTTLARLQLENGDQAAAFITMEQGAPYATGNADFQLFYATLLQRAGKHEEAITHFLAALSLDKQAGNKSSTSNVLVGLGISLRATGNLTDAKSAYTQALQAETISSTLSQFATLEIKRIDQQLGSK